MNQGAVLQAILLVRTRRRTGTGLLELVAGIRRFVCREWFEREVERRADYTRTILEGLNMEAWILSQSGGEEIDRSLLAKLR